MKIVFILINNHLDKYNNLEEYRNNKISMEYKK